MVVIRLSRKGSKKRPFYHMVATNSRSPRDGRYIERLGFYNPIATGGEVKLQLNKDRIDYWLSKGAKASERAEHLIKNFAEINLGEETKTSKKAAKKAEKVKKEIVEVKAEEPKEEKPAEIEAEPKKEEVKIEAEPKTEETKVETEPKKEPAATEEKKEKDTE